MDIFMLLKGIGGLSLFLYGMNTMGESLSKLSGGKMEKVLEQLTSTKFKALLLGILVTAVIQSSSATTVMVVGFVNSGIMQLNQAVGIIIGANIGTTITSWMLSLAGLSGESLLIKLLKPMSFSPILALIGILLTSKKNSDNKKTIGMILLGFATLMFGMDTMSSAVAPLASNESFTSILTMFSNPILGMIAGACLTAAIQSSSASVGILQAFCITGAIKNRTAIPIILGQNIGTCVTALISSVGASKNAKRASIIHLYFNIIGTAIFMTGYILVQHYFNISYLNEFSSAVDIALIHSAVNIGFAIVLYPFANLLVKLATITIKDENDTKEENLLPKELTMLDERFLSNPSYAVQLCKEAACKMAYETKNSVILASEILEKYDIEKENELIEKEKLIDKYEDVLGTYMVQLSGLGLSKKDSQIISVLFHCTSDLERISDHSLNIMESIVEMKNKNLDFSKNALKEISTLTNAVNNIVDMTVDIFVNNKVGEAIHIEPLEEVIDGLNIVLRQNHIERLKNGQCTIELGIILEDLITNLERISDHCSNIGVCLIEVSTNEFDTHEYVDVYIKQKQWFIDEVSKWKKMYQIQ